MKYKLYLPHDLRKQAEQLDIKRDGQPMTNMLLIFILDEVFPRIGVSSYSGEIIDVTYNRQSGEICIVTGDEYEIENKD